MIPDKLTIDPSSAYPHATFESAAPRTAIASPAHRSIAPLAHTPALQVRIQAFQQHCHSRRLTELRRYCPADWSLRDTTIAIRYYSYFLGLIDLYPDRPLVPTPLLDYLWHLHILDTQRYRRDCLALFGCFIDHQPWGQSRQSDLSFENHEQGAESADETRILLRHHFGLDWDKAMLALTSIGSMNVVHAVGSGRSASCSKGACGRGIASEGEEWRTLDFWQK